MMPAPIELQSARQRTEPMAMVAAPARPGTTVPDRSPRLTPRARKVPAHRGTRGRRATIAGLVLALVAALPAQSASPSAGSAHATAPAPAVEPATGAQQAARIATARPDIAPADYTEVYEITLSGIRLAEMAIEARLGPRRYRAEATLETAGVLGAVYTAGFAAKARGRVEGARLRPDRFAADSHDSERRQRVTMTYEAAAPAELVAHPPFKPKPWEVDPLAQGGTADPLSAAVAALHPRSEAALCDRTEEIYDGRRRYRIVLGPARADAGMRHCVARYERIAGFKPKKMEDPVFPFDLWFAPAADGLWRLERAEGATPFGTAALRRAGAG